MKKPASDTIWRDFIQWCAKRRLRSLPAHPWTLAAYLRWRDEKGNPYELKAVVDAVRRAHKKADKRSPDRDPIVERTVALIRNKREARESGSDLFDADSLLFPENPPPEAVENADEESHEEDRSATDRGRKLSSTPRLVSRRPRR